MLFVTKSAVRQEATPLESWVPFWDKDYSMYWEEPTGIPPHIIELAKIAELKRMVGEILPGVKAIFSHELDNRTMNGVLSEDRMRTLVGDLFDQRVAPFVTAMAANREGGGASAALPPGAVQETEDGFFIFNNNGKLRRVPEDWTFPHCPLAPAYELYH
jgi:hypothetical protein